MGDKAERVRGCERVTGGDRDEVTMNVKIENKMTMQWGVQAEFKGAFIHCGHHLGLYPGDA